MSCLHFSKNLVQTFPPAPILLSNDSFVPMGVETQDLMIVKSFFYPSAKKIDARFIAACWHSLWGDESQVQELIYSLILLHNENRYVDLIEASPEQTAEINKVQAYLFEYRFAAVTRFFKQKKDRLSFEMINSFWKKNREVVAAFSPKKIESFFPILQKDSEIDVRNGVAAIFHSGKSTRKINCYLAYWLRTRDDLRGQPKQFETWAYALRILEQEKFSYLELGKQINDVIAKSVLLTKSGRESSFNLLGTEKISAAERYLCHCPGEIEEDFRTRHPDAQKIIHLQQRQGLDALYENKDPYLSGRVPF